MADILHTLWRMSFQACVLIAIVLAARQLLKRYSGLYTRLLWLPVIVRLLCPFFIETDHSLLPDLPFSQAGEEAFGSTNAAPDALTPGRLAARRFADGSQERPGGGAANVPGTAATKTDTEAGRGSSLSSQAGTQGIPLSPPKPDTGQQKNSRSHGILNLLAVLQLLGSITAAVIFCVQFFILKHRISAAVCENGNVWLCENIASPFVVGILRPRIILPYHMETGTRAHVLSHEQTHIRHLDPLLHLIGLICLCLHWWNPAVWLAMHKMNEDMEMFCDEDTLRLAADRQRKDYARTLLSFAEQQSSLHAGPAFGESNTERRIKNIMEKRKKNLLVLGLVVLLTIFCTAAFMTIPKAAKNDSVPENENVTPAAGLVNAPGSTPEGIPTTVPPEGNSVIHTLDTMSVLWATALSLPDFSSEQDMDADFFHSFLFYNYTNALAPEMGTFYQAELSERYSEQYGYYNKITAAELDRVTEIIFGRALSEYVPDPSDIADGGNILYEDGCYYVSTSDSPDFRFQSPQELSAADGMSIVSFAKYLEDKKEPVSQITLYLRPADNELGYVIAGKEEKTPVGFTGSTLTGSFLVTDYFIPPHAKAVGLSQEEIDALIGTQIKFSPDSLRVGEQTYSVVGCKKELVTAREFDELFRLSTGDDLSLSTTAFDHYILQVAESGLPFGSHVYCPDADNALVVYEGVIFKISVLAEDSSGETFFDQLADARFSLPDENGFVEGKQIPTLMLPESILYYTDDTHYIIVKGGIALDTPQKAEEYFAAVRADALAAALNGIHLTPAERPENGMNVTYSGDGGISHLYPRDYPRYKLAEGMLNWSYEDENCWAVVAGLDTAAPRVYYQSHGKDWEVFPLDDFQNLTKEERNAFVLVSVTADAQKITVAFTRDGEEIVKEIKLNK